MAMSGADTASTKRSLHSTPESHSSTLHSNSTHPIPSPTNSHRHNGFSPLYVTALLPATRRLRHMRLNYSQDVSLTAFRTQTFLPLSLRPLPSALPSTTSSRSPSWAPSLAMPTAAHSKQTPRRSTSTPRRPLPPPPRGEAPLSARASRPTVSALSSTPPVPLPTRALPTLVL